MQFYFYNQNFKQSHLQKRTSLILRNGIIFKNNLKFKRFHALCVSVFIFVCTHTFLLCFSIHNANNRTHWLDIRYLTLIICISIKRRLLNGFGATRCKLASDNHEYRGDWYTVYMYVLLIHILSMMQYSL